MNIWLVEISDFVPWIETDQRSFRCGMLAQSLAKAGHAVHWWTSTFNHQLRKHRATVTCHLQVAGNVTLHLLHGPGYKTSTSPQRWIHNHRVAREFSTHASGCTPRPDVIYACLPTLEVGERALEVARGYNAPLIVDIRELHPDNYLTLFPAWTRGAMKLLLHSEYGRARRILQGAAAIMATSEAYLQWGCGLADRARRDLDRVFPLGAPNYGAPAGAGTQGPARSRSPSDELIVSFAGTFTDLFDLDTVVAAARRIASDGRANIRFRLIGAGRNLERVRLEAASVPNVEFTGWLGREALAEELRSSDVGLAPYSSHFPPTLPNKPFEYMSMGLPVLTCARGELKTLVESEGVGVTYAFGQVDDLVGKLYRLAADPQETAAMARRARELFERRFDQDIVYDDMAAHLERVATRPAAGTSLDCRQDQGVLPLGTSRQEN